MSKFFKRTGVITVVVLILVLASTAMAGADGELFLDKSGSNLNLTDQTTAQGNNDYEDIGPSSSATWFSVPAASGGISYGEGMWVVQLYTRESEDGDWSEKCTAKIGEWDGSGFSQVFGTSSGPGGYVQNPTGDPYIIFEFTYATTKTVDEGNRLALQIFNNEDFTTHRVFTRGDSKIDPPYVTGGGFVPELTTGILLGVGLLGLGGFIFIKKRRAGKASS